MFLRIENLLYEMSSGGKEYLFCKREKISRL
jgi:hypothetical protein